DPAGRRVGALRQAARATAAASLLARAGRTVVLIDDLFSEAASARALHRHLIRLGPLADRRRAERSGRATRISWGMPGLAAMRNSMSRYRLIAANRATSPFASVLFHLRSQELRGGVVVAVPVRLGQTGVAAALALAMLAFAPGAAVADPSPAKARAKLVKLNEQADQLVEKYNQAAETDKKAKKKYDRLQAELKSKNRQADALREDLIKAAVGSYQLGSPTGWERMVTEGSPETVLSSLASFDHISRNRVAKLRAFESTTRELRDRHDE